jgi:hypothetical protein
MKTATSVEAFLAPMYRNINNNRDASNSSHDSNNREAIISRNGRKKGLSAIVPATDGKQSTARIQATAVLQ